MYAPPDQRARRREGGAPGARRGAADVHLAPRAAPRKRAGPAQEAPRLGGRRAGRGPGGRAPSLPGPPAAAGAGPLRRPAQARRGEGETALLRAAGEEGLRRRAVSHLQKRGGALLFMRGEEKLSEEQKAYLGRLCEADGALADAHRLTQEFAKMVRDLEGEKLDGRLEEAEACEAPAMRNFAAGLRKDLPAVRAGLTGRWSNGPVEGFVNKLKLVKRQGYGTAGFELLRARMRAA